jgi:hypothetical protein
MGRAYTLIVVKLIVIIKFHSIHNFVFHFGSQSNYLGYSSFTQHVCAYTQHTHTKDDKKCSPTLTQTHGYFCIMLRLPITISGTFARYGRASSGAELTRPSPLQLFRRGASQRPPP